MVVLAGAVLAGIALGAYAAVTAQQDGSDSTATPTGGTPGPDATPAQTEAPLPTLAGEAPNACGDWPAAAADGPIASQYGEIRNCVLFEGTWVIATLGKVDANGVRAAGVIALYPCHADEACLDNRTEHPLAGWEIVKPPFSNGGITIMGVLNGELLLGKYTFNVVTRTFTLLTPATAEPTAAATGS